MFEFTELSKNENLQLCQRQVNFFVFDLRLGKIYTKYTQVGIFYNIQSSLPIFYSYDRLGGKFPLESGREEVDHIKILNKNRIWEKILLFENGKNPSTSEFSTGKKTHNIKIIFPFLVFSVNSILLPCFWKSAKKVFFLDFFSSLKIMERLRGDQLNYVNLITPFPLFYD